MLVAAAVCPHTPLLVPALAGAAQGELYELRSACHTAVAALRDTRPDLLVVVGGADRTRGYGAQAAGSLHPWGVDIRVGRGEPVLPLSLTVGRWLLESGSYDIDPVAFQAVDSAAGPEDCLALGAKLAGDGRVALLVMADGSACLTPRAPGHHDPAARPYHDLLVRALAGADGEALADLDPAVADRLWVGGRAALQVLAGAASGARFTGRVLAEAAPYGVGYFAGLWEQRPL
ncbi:class III extradiol ring-cleavage dioxygenase family protein [Nonomuraea glycinis]|uniref:hypothetical protein n=1 Tax=Nonomuraea glycinis TaxID=2047744 RepID=UPI002E168756|nr:hypothetical protein OHA68_25200 [Nonomuraea glycinis]